MSSQVKKWFNDDEDQMAIRPKDPRYTLTTPCTRFQRLSLKVEEAVQNYEHAQCHDDLFSVSDPGLTHPNLDMTINDKKILIKDKLKESDDILEDDDDDSYYMNDVLSMPQYDKFDADFDLVEEDLGFSSHYDQTTHWLSLIYHSDETEDAVNTIMSMEDDTQWNDEENRPPRNWSSPRTEEKKPVIDNQERIPLKEVITTKEEQSASKKRLISSGKAHIRIMRTLSPPRFSTKVKDTAVASS